MAIKQLQVDVDELTVGMFVSALDRPWTQTPFPLQGFYLRDLDEIKELKVHCNYVYIDVVKGPAPLETRLKTYKGDGRSKLLSRVSRHAKFTNVAPLKVRRDIYRYVAPVEKEMGRARDLHQQIHRAVGSVMEQIDVDVGNVPVKETKRVASAMVDSILRSPDAFSWLIRVREKDEHTYTHAVRAAILAILFGRHIGLPKPELDVLAMGVLLKDIGKTKLPRHIIEKQQRSETEQEGYESFVDYGVEILSQLPEIKPRVTSIVKTHCERINGSGFPNHLRGDNIPLVGKIAGIVTFYDEMTHPRGRSSRSPSRAVAKLYDNRGVEFQEELVVEFIRAIGLYPTGTMVELSNGAVGVVMEQNFDRRLKPIVMVVVDANKKVLKKPYVLDLAQDEREKQMKVDSGKVSPDDVEHFDIVQDLKPGSYDIDLVEMQSRYINKKQGKSLFYFLKKISGL